MTQEYKTLRELDVQPGDVVENNTGSRKIIAHIDCDECCMESGVNVWRFFHPWLWNNPIWRIVSRASDTPKLWRDMTPEEKGALLLAHHEGKVIEWLDPYGIWFEVDIPLWHEERAYRVSPAEQRPKRETVTLHGSVTDEVWGRGTTGYDTHRITFELKDGEPDFDSIKMEPL